MKVVIRAAEQKANDNVELALEPASNGVRIVAYDSQGKKLALLFKVTHAGRIERYTDVPKNIGFEFEPNANGRSVVKTR